MNRTAFIAMMRDMLDEMETDHEEHTGIADTETMPFKDWLGELEALHENTRA